MTSSQRDAPLIEARFPIVKKLGEPIFTGLLWPTSEYQARSPWTEIGGNHLVRDPDYTVDAKEPPIRALGASGASPKMCVAWRCPDGRQFRLC